MPVLRGSKCLLRPLCREDLATTLPWRHDVALRNAIFGHRFPVTKENESAWYDRVLGESGKERAIFAICRPDADTALGTVRLYDIDWISRLAEFGIFLADAAARGKGMGKQAAALILNYAFDDLNLNRVHLRVAADNQAAIRLYQSLGFTQEGVLRAHIYVENAYHDVVVMGLLRTERAACDAALA